MEKKELFEQVEGMLCEFHSKNLVESTEEKFNTLDEMLRYIMLGAKAFTTDELVKELIEREGALTLKKKVDMKFPLLDDIYSKFNGIAIWYKVAKDKKEENPAFNGLYNLLKELKEDYKKINNFYNNGAVG